MPAPRKQISQEQIDARREFCRAAIALGAIQRHQMGEYPIDTKFEHVCFDGGVAMQQIPQSPQFVPSFRPVTSAEWIADCKQRGVVAVIPNL